MQYCDLNNISDARWRDEVVSNVGFYIVFDLNALLSMEMQCMSARLVFFKGWVGSFYVTVII